MGGDCPCIDGLERQASGPREKYCNGECEIRRYELESSCLPAPQGGAAGAPRSPASLLAPLATADNAQTPCHQRLIFAIPPS